MAEDGDSRTTESDSSSNGDPSDKLSSSDVSKDMMSAGEFVEFLSLATKLTLNLSFIFLIKENISPMRMVNN